MVVAGRGKCDINTKLRAYLERPRGHSKTSDLAVMVTWALFASKRPLSGVAAAADKEQAALLRKAVSKLISLNVWLREVIEVQANRIVNTVTGSELVILASDAPSSYGLTPDFVIADELTHWPDGKGEELWNSLFSAVAKRSQCLLIIISNAGTGEGKSWQWRVREQARTAEDWHFHTLNGPVASWISQKHLAEQRRMLPDVAYRRLWQNEWTSGSGDAIAEADILRAIRIDSRDRPTEAQSGKQYFAGLDLGLSRDASSLVIVSQSPGTRGVQLVDVQAWTPKAGERVSIETVQQALLDADDRFHFAGVFVDPWQAELLVEQCERQGVNIERTPFTVPNLRRMASAVIECFSEGLVDLYAHDLLLADLRSLRLVERGGVYRLAANRDATGHADRATALSLALLAARSHQPTGCGVFVPDMAKVEQAAKQMMERVMPKVEAMRKRVNELRYVPWERREPGTNAITLTT